MEAAVQGIIYGLPLVTMDLTMKRMTNVLHPGGIAAPVNQFAHAPISASSERITIAGPFIALIAFGANRPEDSFYPTAFMDGKGNPLNGANRYILHFDAGLTPPVKAFWSVTMYDPQSFFVNNALGRYAISNWMSLQHNSDGSLDIYIQNESPGADKEANWLPSPNDGFNITMRLYWPNDHGPSIIDGSWKPPPVIKNSGASVAA